MKHLSEHNLLGIKSDLKLAAVRPPHVGCRLLRSLGAVTQKVILNILWSCFKLCLLFLGQFYDVSHVPCFVTCQVDVHSEHVSIISAQAEPPTFIAESYLVARVCVWLCSVERLFTVFSTIRSAVWIYFFLFKYFLFHFPCTVLDMH